MTVNELEAMADQAQADDQTVEDEAAAAATPEPEQPAPGPTIDLDQLAAMFGFLLQGIGNIICDRAGVTALHEDETEPVARAGIQLMMMYDFSVNPKVAAWCAFGMVTAPPVLMRIEERREARKVQEEAAKKSEPPPEEPSKVYGEGENVTPAAVKPESKRRGRSKKT